MISYGNYKKFNREERVVMMKHVTFKNASIEMKGDLYTPENFDESKKYPAIVAVHPGGAVKEQVSGLYSKRMAEMGYIALAFDASHQGESGGEPRYLENPTERVEDIRSAIDYLSTLSYVDMEKVGVLGICAGGGYSINAALTEKRIKAVATISAFDIGAGFRGDGMPGGLEATLETLNKVAAMRSAQTNGEDSLYITYVPNTEEEAKANPMVLMKEAYDYYRTPRAQHPNSTNKLLFTSLDKIIAFSAFGFVPTLLTQPILAIVGSEANTKGFSENAIELANSPKELFEVKGATHIAMYDVPEYVNQAVNKLGEFFGENL